MFNIDKGEFIVNSVTVWVDLGLSLLVLGCSLFLLSRILKRKLVFSLVAVSFVLLFTAWFFGLHLLWSASLIVSLSLIIVSVLVNQGAIRDSVANALVSTKKGTTEKVFDRRALLQKVDIAVQNLSKNKIGAIITFEKDTKLDDFIKTGTILNAPVTPELLMTIFYPGTRLHDGAVVLRRENILAASVYYTPTSKPLTGKFGSRHRAAIGISEVSDSVTVVVSEETGRISIAVAGELIHVPADTFLRTLEDYVLSTVSK